MRAECNRHLILSPHALWREDISGITIECPGADISIELPAGSPLRNLLPAFDGSHSLRALSVGLGMEEAAFYRLSADLADCALLWDATDLVACDNVERQLDCYYDLCDNWALDIFQSPFWRRMFEGTASPSLVLGWCEQFYHRTVGADLHNATAVEFCEDDEIRAELAAHFDEEFGHGEIFIRGLEKSGVPREEILARSPLETTAGLIDYMDVLGQTDTIAYLGCYGVLHSPRKGQTVEAARSQFNHLSQLYPFAAPAMQAVMRHVELDFGAQHDQIVLEKLIRRRGALDHDPALRVLRAARGMVISFVDFFDGIFGTYDVPET